MKRLSTKILFLSALILLALSPISVHSDTVITVDDNCSLANAIRSANGEDQVEESGDDDGNDDCEAGVAPDDTAVPPETGADTINLSADVTLSALLPSITSEILIEGGNRSISGDDQFPVFLVSGGALSINELTVTEGLVTTFGGAIYVNDGSLTVTDSKVTDSVAGDIGGGIYANESDITITDSEISGNSTVRSHGGGVYFVSSTGSHTLSIDRVNFKNNVAVEDGGGLKTAGGIVNISKSTFVGNEADEGGAIESSESTLTIYNSTFSTNEAREGGGLSSFASDATLTHTTWAFNTAEEQGGAIAIIGWTGSFKIRNTLITDNEHGEGGYQCHSGPNPAIIVEFTGNLIQDGSCVPEDDEEEDETEEDDSTPVAQSVAISTPTGDESAVEDTSEDFQAQHVPGDDHEEHDDAMINALTGSPAVHSLRWGSPAIDNGDPAYCGVDALVDDQVDTMRPQYDNCDIGAWEYPKPPDPPPAPPPTEEEPEEPEEPDETPEVEPPVIETPTSEVPPRKPEPPPNICPVNSRIFVRSHNHDIKCVEIDTITLDKHPALQGIRFATRLWRANRACTHIVAPGENLYRLAIRYNSSVDVFRRYNNLPTNQLSIGQRLLLPTCSPETVAFDPGTEICFADRGALALIDTATPERTIHSIESFDSEGMTCGKVDRPGVVVLLAQETG